MDENGIIHIAPHEDVNMDYEDALDNNLVVKRLGKGEPILKLIDSRAKWTITKKARSYIQSTEIRDKTIARAVVKNSFLDSLLLIFFLSLNKPRIPTKIFTDYDNAYKWLMNIRRNGNTS